MCGFRPCVAGQRAPSLTYDVGPARVSSRRSRLEAESSSDFGHYIYRRSKGTMQLGFRLGLGLGLGHSSENGLPYINMPLHSLSYCINARRARATAFPLVSRARV